MEKTIARYEKALAAMAVENCELKEQLAAMEESKDFWLTRSMELEKKLEKLGLSEGGPKVEVA